MGEIKEVELNEELNEEIRQLTRKKDMVKIIMIASIIMSICDIASIIFSIIENNGLVVKTKEIGYFVVLAVCLIIFVVSLILFNQTKKQIENKMDK